MLSLNMIFIKKIGLVLLLLGISILSIAQCEKVYTKVDKIAEFKSGKSWIHFIKQKLVPVFEHATTDELSYTSNLDIELIIDTSGKVVNVKFPGNLTQITKYLKVVENRIIQNTLWNPAIKDGKKVCYKSKQVLSIGK